MYNYNGDILENIIERDNEMQLEFIPKTDSIESISKISWEDCSYELKAYKYREKKDNPLKAKIINVKAEVYYVESKLETSFWLYRLFEKTKPPYKFIKVLDTPSERFYKAKTLINKGILPSNAKSWN